MCAARCGRTAQDRDVMCGSCRSAYEAGSKDPETVFIRERRAANVARRGSRRATSSASPQAPARQWHLCLTCLARVDLLDIVFIVAGDRLLRLCRPCADTCASSGQTVDRWVVDNAKRPT